MFWQLLCLHVGHLWYALLCEHISFLMNLLLLLPRNPSQSYSKCGLLGQGHVFLPDSDFSMAVFSPMVLFCLNYGSYPVSISADGFLGLASHSLALYGNYHLGGNHWSCDICTISHNRFPSYLPCDKGFRNYLGVINVLEDLLSSRSHVQGVKCSKGILVGLNTIFSQICIEFWFLRWPDASDFPPPLSLSWIPNSFFNVSFFSLDVTFCIFALAAISSIEAIDF